MATASCKGPHVMPVLALLEQLHLTILSMSLNATTFRSIYSTRRNKKVGKDPAWLDWWYYIKVNPAVYFQTKKCHPKLLVFEPIQS